MYLYVTLHIKKASLPPETANLALQDRVWFSLSWSHLKPAGLYHSSLIGIKIGLYFTHRNGPILGLKGIFRELEQQIRGRLRKHHLKTEFPLLQTWSRLVQSHSIRQMLANCLGVQWILRDCTVQEGRRKDKETRYRVSKSSTKREIRKFHVAVVQRRQRNVQKSVTRLQSCCFTDLKLLFFLPFLLPSPSSLLKLSFLIHSVIRLPFCSCWPERYNSTGSPELVTVYWLRLPESDSAVLQDNKHNKIQS